jgi:hypothetical protein
VAGLTDLVRRRQAPCAEVALALPAYVAGETSLDERASHHVAQCLRCQAEIVRYRRMLRTLRALRDDAPLPPSTVLADIIGQLGADDVGGPTLIGIVAVVALAAGAAGGAGMLLWFTRRSRPTERQWLVTAMGSRRRELQEMATRFSMRSATTKAITTT